jgi:hypothetical protein
MTLHLLLGLEPAFNFVPCALLSIDSSSFVAVLYSFSPLLAQNETQGANVTAGMPPFGWTATDLLIRMISRKESNERSPQK